MISTQDIFDNYKIKYDGTHIKNEEGLKSIVPNGELIDITNSKNKIKKINNDEYMFLRYDSVNTLKHENNSPDLNVNLKKDIYPNMDYDLDYGQDRSILLNEALGNYDLIYQYLSEPRIIGKENKNKKDFLSKDQPFDKQLEVMASYIIHPKFRDEDDELYYNWLTNTYKDAKKENGKDEKSKDVIFELKSELDLINQQLLTKSKEDKDTYREELTGKIEEFESVGELESSFSKEKSKNYRIGKELKIDNDYWERMGFSEVGAKERNEIVHVYEEAIGIMSRQLGYDKDADNQKKIQNNLLDELETIQFNRNGNKVVIDPIQRLNKLKKMYSEIVSDYYTAKEIMAEIVTFMQPTNPSTEYDFNYDTWYLNESNEVVEVSKNALNFSDPNTYKGLINTYYDLNDKYKDEFNSDMWAILHVFEDILKHTNLTDEEKFIVSELMNDRTRKDIIEGYLDKFGKKISPKVLSTNINKKIPNKIVETYIKSVDEWLYTYWIKGDYKKCSNCGEVKLISNDRYFRKRKDSVDGFRNECRECESSAKNGKK